MALPSPAPACTVTVWPSLIVRRTVSGVAATRVSPGATSRGTKIVLMVLVLAKGLPAVRREGAEYTTSVVSGLLHARRGLWLRMICALACTGCAAPDFTERRALADPAMRLEAEPTEGHFRRKATDAREAGA